MYYAYIHICIYALLLSDASGTQLEQRELLRLPNDHLRSEANRGTLTLRILP